MRGGGGGRHPRAAGVESAGDIDMEQIEYGGITYAVVAEGVISLRMRERHIKRSNGRYDPCADGMDPPEGQVQRCIAWLKEFAAPRKTLNTRYGSYGLKHIVEDWCGEYVCNGAMIEAVRRLGWDVVPDGPDSPNACFRLSYVRWMAKVKVGHKSRQRAGDDTTEGRR